MTTAELHRRTVAERDWLDHLNSSPKDVEIEITYAIAVLSFQSGYEKGLAWARILRPLPDSKSKPIYSFVS